MYWQVVEWPEWYAGMTEEIFAEGLAGKKEMTDTLTGIVEEMAERLTGTGLVPSAADA